MGEDKKVKKVGMKDIQREGWEYELTVSLNIDRDTHKATASKDRTNIFEGKDPFVITPETGKAIKSWCEMGEEEKQPIKELLTDEHPKWNGIIQALRDGRTIEQLKKQFTVTEATEQQIVNLLSIPA